MARALRSVDAVALGAVEAAADLGAEFHPVAREAIVEALIDGDPAGQLERPAAHTGVDTVVTAGLLYGQQELMLVPEAMGVLPSTWRLLKDSADVAALDDVDATQRGVLETLASAGGLGSTRDAAPDADPTKPVPQLLAKGLLIRVDSSHVRLPRSVAHRLRGGAQFPLTPPDAPSASDQDATGAAQGLETTRLIRRLVEHLGQAPAPLNKDNTVGVRAVDQLAKALGHSVEDVHQLVSVAVAAGLVGRGELDDELAYLAPTAGSRDWLDVDLAQQWAVVLQGWWSSPFQPWMVGTEIDGQPVRLLSDAMRNEQLPQRRRLVTAIFLDGKQYSADQFLAAFRFARPLAAAMAPAGETTALLDEAALVGAIAHGSAATWLRSLHAGEEIAEDVASATPPAVHQVIVQADMTLLAPGPLPVAMQQAVELMADLESPGLASVYRVTEASLRRAMDAGCTAGDILGWFDEHAIGEVPQTLGYLVEDLARRHGHLRGGVAMSYVRSDDPAQLDAVFATPAAAEAALRRLAPTVAISSRRLAEVIDVLSAHHLHAVAEDANGAAVDIRPEPVKVPAEKIRTCTVSTIDPARVEAAVRTIRGATSDDASEPEGQDIITTLQAAARAGRTVTVGVVDKNGTAMHLRVTPLTVTAGQVDAVDPVTKAVRRFPVHRITQVKSD